jgi:hypothetical protein
MPGRYRVCLVAVELRLEDPDFAGKHVVIDGMSRGLISDYSESVNGGVAMVQLGVAAPRIEKVLQRWVHQLLERPGVRTYLAVPR